MGRKQKDKRTKSHQKQGKKKVKIFSATCQVDIRGLKQVRNKSWGRGWGGTVMQHDVGLQMRPPGLRRRRAGDNETAMLDLCRAPEWR